MNEIFPSIHAWVEEERPFGIARVIKTWGSSPRPVGSSMLISDKMEMVGSVSGGCVESEVLKSAQEVIKNGGGKLMHFGISDEDAWTVGLSCGGELDVFIQQFVVCPNQKGFLELWDTIDQLIHNNEGFVLITKIKDGLNENTVVTANGKIYGIPINDELIHKAKEVYDRKKHEVFAYNGDTYFVHILPKKSQLLIIGAAHISADLVQLAKLFNFEVVVIDPRGAFAQKTYFKVAPDQIIEKYPSEALSDFSLDAYTYATVLSHDPKIDNDALRILLKSDVCYIGALGSRKTHQKRKARLIEEGFDEEFLNERIDAPIGVDINAKDPKEIALSIMAKIIAMKNQYA